MDGSLTFVGIDVAKASLDVATLPHTQTLSLAYDDDGIARIIATLRPLGACLVVVEATGGLERRLVTALVDAGFRVARVNPRQARDFARGLGLFAKTDRLDAQLLARFAQHVQPQPLEKHPENRPNSNNSSPAAANSSTCEPPNPTAANSPPPRSRDAASNA